MTEKSDTVTFDQGRCTQLSSSDKKCALLMDISTCWAISAERCMTRSSREKWLGLQSMFWHTHLTTRTSFPNSNTWFTQSLQSPRYVTSTVWSPIMHATQRCARTSELKRNGRPISRQYMSFFTTTTTCPLPGCSAVLKCGTSIASRHFNNVHKLMYTYKKKESANLERFCQIPNRACTQ